MKSNESTSWIKNHHENPKAAVHNLLTTRRFEHLSFSRVQHHQISVAQVEMMSAVDQRSAAMALDSLPAGNSALLSAGSGLRKRLSALMEALDYTIQRELEDNSTKLPLKEQRMLEEDAKLQQELQESEMSAWDKKLEQGRKRLWGGWGQDGKKK